MDKPTQEDQLDCKDCQHAYLQKPCLCIPCSNCDRNKAVTPPNPSTPLEKCAYCGETHPQSEMIQHKVIHYHTQRHLDKMRWYCKDKPCAGYHQMSLEG